MSMTHKEIGALADYLRHPNVEDYGMHREKCRQAAELLDMAKYSFWIELNNREIEHLREADELVRVNDLLDRFIDVDEAYGHTPWNLSQIINNIAMVAGVEE